jgi:thiol peroxidase
VVLTISDDLPFAQSRFCESENIGQVVTLSEMRERSFGDDYGVRMVDGPLAGILSRAVVVIDDNDKVVYTEQVSEIAQEPDYEKALEAARKA